MFALWSEEGGTYAWNITSQVIASTHELTLVYNACTEEVMVKSSYVYIAYLCLRPFVM